MHRHCLRPAILTALCAAICVLPASVAAGSDDDRDERIKLRAEAEDEDSGFRFKADYKSRTDGERSRLKFKVRVWDGHAGDVLPVSVNGLLIDVIRIDESGNGRLRLRADDMPHAMPALAAGDFVVVGYLGQALEDRDHSGRRHRSRLRLRADFDDDEDGVRADAKYDVRTRRGEMRRRFKASVEGAEDGDEFDVLINGDLVGTIEADEWGEGKLDLRERGAQDDEFPMLQEGDVVTIGDASAEFELK